MATDQEIIEARLAAYVEGDLPPHERGEIEKYLAANPQHAQLINELQAHRAQLATLPRERAPAEVLDHLQSHLERSALLDNVEGEAESMRIRRWPQWMAVAAMLLLAVGLGALVYQVLPGPNPRQVTLAPAPMQHLPSAPSLEEGELDEQPRRQAMPRSVPGESRGQDFVEQMVERMAADAENAKEAPAAGETRARSELANRDAPSVTAAPAPIPEAPLGMDLSVATVALAQNSAIVVDTDDTLITQNLVAGVLADNQITYNALPANAVHAAGPATAPAEGIAEGNAADVQTAQHVFNRLQVKGDAQLAQPADQAYLLARNVPVEKAEEITRQVSAQRMGKQQARLYSPGELYPELQSAHQLQQNLAQSEPPAQKSFAMEEAASTRPSEQAEAGEVLAPAPAAAEPDVGLLATRPTTLPDLSTIPPVVPSAKAEAVTDLLIIVRTDSTPAPATQPETLDPSPVTQPSTLPTPLPDPAAD